LSAEHPTLPEILVDAQARGLLGPGDPRAHIDHAAAFALVAEATFGGTAPRRFLDLGSGGGLPGLVLAQRWARASATLLDASTRRCDFLRDAATRLELTHRVEVRLGRAEVLARDPGLAEQFPLVVARSFGTPAVTAELAARFLEAGGVLLVSEPPEPDPRRWPPGALERLGLGPAVRTRAAGSAVVRIERVAATPEQYPRRTGMPEKRPLW
jgi:16S rRNA (guanine527-N7)-methyltransferase